MSDDVTNQAPGGVGDQGAEQAAAEATQATQATEQTETGGAVPNEIVVGNQRFSDVASLSKAYEELQKGFTQSSQKYSEQLKAYQAYDAWIKELGPQGRKALSDFVSQQRAQAAKPPTAPAQPQQPTEQAQYDPRLERMAMETAAKVEFMEFRSKHPDLTVDQLGKVAEVVERYDARGLDLPMEDAYRIAFFEDASAKNFSAGQKKAEDAITRSRQATSVTPTAASAQATPKKEGPRFNINDSLDSQKDAILRHLRDSGATFDRQ